jgi:integrase
MALFRQKGRATWQARYYRPGPDGKLRQVSVSTGTTDRAEAELFAAQLTLGIQGRADRDHVENALNRLLADRRESPAMTLVSAEREYRRLTKDDAGDRAAEQRMELVCKHWARFTEWCGQKHPTVTQFRDVGPDMTREFAGWLKVNSASPKTAKNILFNAARLYRVVMPSARVSVDPFHKVSVSTAGVETEVKPLTQAQYGALCKATAGTEYAGAITTAWYTGLRYSDVAHLRWDEITADGIRLAPHKTRKHGIRVTIPIHPKLRAYLDSIPPKGRGEYVFPELQKTYGNRRTADRFAEACKAAGIRDRDGLTFHSIRHAFVTRLSAAGIAEDVRRKLVGHSNAATHDGYDHDVTRAREAVNALE